LIQLKIGHVFFYTTILENLTPDSIYYYRVGDKISGIMSEFYSFKTKPIGPFPSTIVTFSDFDTVNEINKEKSTMKRLANNLSEFDLILQYGDISYANGDQGIWDTFF